MRYTVLLLLCLITGYIHAQGNIEIGLGARLNKKNNISPGLGLSVPVGKSGSIYTEFSRTRNSVSFYGEDFGYETLNNVDVVYQFSPIQNNSKRIQWLLGSGVSYADYSANTSRTDPVFFICFSPGPLGTIPTTMTTNYNRAGRIWGTTLHNTIRFDINSLLAIDTKAIITAYNFRKIDDQRKTMPNYVLQTSLVYKIGL
jgi:hypothetical protein